MNLVDAKYKDFALVREMLETPGIIRKFQFGQAAETAQIIKLAGRLLLTGEGSSRIFPAKNLIAAAMQLGMPLTLATDGSRQAMEYDLTSFAVFGASNSGQTKEVIALFNQLKAQGHQRLFGLTANQGTKLEQVSNKCYILSCGKENAVAATKSVVEQALFYRSLFCPLEPGCALAGRRDEAADKAAEVLAAELDPAIVDAVANARMIYFAGRNNGVAEELTLKTNEITRKKSDYLEGTYAVHGIEEVMNADEVVILVDPYAEEVDKFRQVLVDGVKLKVVAISSKPTPFPTIQIPACQGFDTVLQLLAGWNVLVQVGVRLGINLDKPQRARKVGNEFLG